MLHYITARDLNRYPRLRASMFRDRADQFHTRLGWDVSIDPAGEERDAYDACDPLYVIWEEADGRHGGSMRFLPTTGPTMINDHFADLLAPRPIRDRRVLECTRFCLARNATPRVSAALMLGGCEVGLGHGLSHSVGVFDARMTRIYARLGWTPQVIGSRGTGRDRVSAGLWTFSEAQADALAERAGIPRELSQEWFDRARDGWQDADRAPALWQDVPLVRTA